MPMNGTQIGLAAAAAVAAGYYFMNHQQNKNAVDKASDRFEQGKLEMKQRSGDNSLGTAANRAYYDAKEKARS